MRYNNRFRGCLIGGAAGDALGYEVEFIGEEEIFRTFGKQGITEYVLHEGYARISDDTQMTLFTANGLLVGAADNMRLDPIAYITQSYLDWLQTQFSSQFGIEPGKVSWLNNIEELNRSRDPGRTCIGNLGNRNFGSVVAPRNDSKGCGGVMRVAPIGLFFEGLGLKVEQIDMIAADAAALTHGHELGYIPAAAFAHIIYRVAHCPNPDLKAAVREAIDTMPVLFPDAKYMPEFLRIMNLAVELSESNQTDLDAIHQLGEGWVAEEALAIAVYCALKYPNDFASAIIAAANHKGDSDSTAAICGNILGAALGLAEIPDKFLKDLELVPVLMQIADDLCDLDPNSPNWKEKYITHTYAL